MLRTLSIIAVLCVIWLGLAASGMAGPAFPGDKIDRMEAKMLLAKIDSPDIVIIDVRRARDFEGSELVIKNAVRRAYNDVSNWAGEYGKEQTLVLYCA